MLHSHKPKTGVPDYVSGPNGIFTRNQVLFPVSSNDLALLLEPVRDEYSASRVVLEAEAAVLSTKVFPVYVLLAVLMIWNVAFGVVLSLLFAIFWYREKSAFAGTLLRKGMRFLSNDVFFVLSGVLAISPLGNRRAYIELAVAMVFFLSHRFGLIEWLIIKAHGGNDDLLARNLRALVMVARKARLKSGKPDNEIAAMEAELFKRIAQPLFGKKKDS
jgi:hypothetical protein